MVIGLHGVWSNGSGSTDLILEGLESLGNSTLEVDWGVHDPLSAARNLNKLADRIYVQIIQAQICSGHPSAIAHSFGCNILVKAMEMGVCFDRVWLFNPVLDPKTNFPADSYKRITVICDQDDAVVRWAHRLLWWAKYGNMGTVGYLGKSPRVETVPGPTPLGMNIGAHGDAFEGEIPWLWAKHIHMELERSAA